MKCLVWHESPRSVGMSVLNDLNSLCWEIVAITCRKGANRKGYNSRKKGYGDKFSIGG